LGPCRRVYDLELCSERMRVEIPTVDGINLLNCNHYLFSTPNRKLLLVIFRHLQNILDISNACVILQGHFNDPGFDWESATYLSNCHYYFKLERDAMFISTCLLACRQCVKTVDAHNLLDVAFKISLICSCRLCLGQDWYTSPSF
jgi:hypothetical protein